LNNAVIPATLYLHNLMFNGWNITSGANQLISYRLKRSATGIGIKRWAGPVRCWIVGMYIWASHQPGRNTVYLIVAHQIP